MLTADVQLDTAPLDKALADVTRAIETGNNPHLRRGLGEAGAEMMAFVRREFQKNSAGGWPDIKPTTKLRRARKDGIKFKTPPPAIQQVAGMHFPIGYDTGRMFRSLTPGQGEAVDRVDGPDWEGGSEVPYLGPFNDGRAGIQAPRPVFTEPDKGTTDKIGERIGDGVGRMFAEVFGQ